ncbi:MAG: hypothetical protein H0S77_01525 [Spirochaetaceae bacterium]|nr:hypothetical protein [Spirochaetaceae bacterium]
MILNKRSIDRIGLQGNADIRVLDDALAQEGGLSCACRYVAETACTLLDQMVP